MILTPSKTPKHADIIVQGVLETLCDDTFDRQARAIVSRLSRSYTHATICGEDFILVPAQQSPLASTRVNKLEAAA
jgi:hypothetical protein